MIDSASDIILQQNEEYEESLRQDILREQENLPNKQSILEEEELPEHIEVEAEKEKEKPLSPHALRELRIRYFEKKEFEVGNRGIKRKNGINTSLILKSKLRSGIRSGKT